MQCLYKVNQIHFSFSLLHSLLIRYSRAFGSYQDFLDKGLLLTMKLLNQGFLLVQLKSSLNVLRSPPWLGWPLWNICVTNDHGYVPLFVNTSPSFPHSWHHRVCNYIDTTGATSRAGTAYHSRASQFIPGFDGVRVTRSLVLFVCFVNRCLSFCPFAFGHCVVCYSSIYGFWLPLWYLQTLDTTIVLSKHHIFFLSVSAYISNVRCLFSC